MAGGPALDIDMKDWQMSLDVMLAGSFNMARHVLPYMKAAGWGRIINLGSLMSNTAFGEDPIYCTAKAGILGLTRSLAAEFGPYNICVNTLCPGNILTEMMEKVAANAEKRDGLQPGSFLAERAKAIPLRRIGQPEDVAKLASFLCGPDADYITGQSIHVNGGLYYNG